MLYPVAIDKGNDTTAFGVVVPDVPGCFSAGDSYEDALIQAKEALESHFELMADNGDVPPSATSIDQYRHEERFAGWTWDMVDVDIEPYTRQAKQKNN